jgi:trimethylamine:corrinoid methyltransferase-like protein
MKSEALLTQLSDRDSREAWQKKGGLDSHTRAMARVREILARESTTLFSEDIETRVRMQYNNLVPGKLEMPQGM